MWLRLRRKYRLVDDKPVSENTKDKIMYVTTLLTLFGERVYLRDDVKIEFSS